MQFLKAFMGTFAGKFFGGIAVAALALIGFGPEYWSARLLKLASDPLGISLIAARAIFLCAALALVAFLTWPAIKRRIWRAPACYVEKIGLIAGIDRSTTTPVRLIAKAKTSTKRLKIAVEYSSFGRAVNWAGWHLPRQVLLQTVDDVMAGQDIRVVVVTCDAAATEVWWGGPNDREGNWVQKSKKHRARIKFVGDDGDVQYYAFGLLRTSLDEPPFIVEVITEADLSFGEQ
ncbi:hypothetical protein [Rhodopseudomonas sp. BR0M22]|uniref:hypothetical protein n=1 Tax=Rhodopseudomonas sp. BR0M22 TaxID=2269369 RepID=UPI0013DE7AC1|nr:hypothetical protein [Rhodopseudomonas sp. BR0M22]NEW92766.1 hypothetical protein [Rhodopseudomonas sp. BR0M22]